MNVTAKQFEALRAVRDKTLQVRPHPFLGRYYSHAFLYTVDDLDITSRIRALKRKRLVTHRVGERLPELTGSGEQVLKGHEASI